jgi:hypothetical protein
MMITNGGNVGIGTTAPTARFGVKLATATAVSTIANSTGWDNTYAVFGNPESGTSQGFAIGISNTLNGINLISVNPMSDWVDTNYYSRNHIFYGGGTERMRITSGGNVGIGTTSPNAKMQIVGSGGARATMLQLTSGGTSDEGLFINTTGTGNDFYAIKVATGADANAFALTNAGNVGIGTTTPESRLMINGDWADMTGTITYSTNTKGIILNQDGGGGQGMGIWFRQAGLTAGIGSTRVSGGDWATDLRFYTHPSSTTNQNILFERMRINSEGNVGIGTTSPDLSDWSGAANGMQISDDTWAALKLTGSTGKLFIASGASANYIYGYNSVPLVFGANNSEGFRLNASGNLSIGNTNDTYKLDVTGEGRFTGNVTANELRLTGSAAIANTTTGGYLALYGNTGGLYLGAFNAGANQNYAFINASTGNVGIGTTSPAARLQVSGGEIRVDAGQAITLDVSNNMYLIGASNQLRLYNGGNPVVNITTGGNVGIGTTSPTRLLEVSGSSPSLAVIGTSGSVPQLQLVSGGVVNWSLRTNQGAASDFTIYQDSTERIRITSTGNVGIGTTTPNAASRLTVLSSGTSTSAFGNVVARLSSNGSGYASTLVFSDEVANSAGISMLSGNLLFGTSGYDTERMRITSAGEVWMGYTSDQGAYLLQVNGAVFASSYFESSDTRLKNITNTYNGLDFGAIQYTWKDGRDAKLHWGYAAQDVMKYIPDAVNENKDGFLSLDYNQAHTYKIAMLENRIAELEKQLNNK